MVDVPKLTLLQVAGIRANTEKFIMQRGGSTVVLMPMSPQRLLAMCDTIEQLYRETENAEVAGDK